MNLESATAAKNEPKTWNHVAWVRDGDQVRVYLNGNAEPEIAGTLESTIDATTSRRYFGGRGDNFANMEGKLDEIAIYDRILPAEEIAAHIAKSQ
jgi:hypothetical protein